MKINVEFDSLEEMREFIDKANAAGGEMTSGPVASEAQQIPPAALVDNLPKPQPVPVQQTAPVQPTAPPVQQTIQQPVPTQASVPPVQQAAPAAVPTSAPSYTLDDLARAGMTLMDAGRQGDLQQLLARFGVEALPALPPVQYGAFATALREMGAQI